MASLTAIAVAAARCAAWARVPHLRDDFAEFDALPATSCFVSIMSQPTRCGKL